MGRQPDFQDRDLDRRRREERARLGAAWSPGVSLNDATRASIGTESALGPEASRASRNDHWSQGRVP